MLFASVAHDVAMTITELLANRRSHLPWDNNIPLRPASRPGVGTDVGPVHAQASNRGRPGISDSHCETSSPPVPEKFKIALIGGSGVGKTTMIHGLFNNPFEDDYVRYLGDS